MIIYIIQKNKKKQMKAWPSHPPPLRLKDYVFCL